jgi:hypothetical protein
MMCVAFFPSRSPLSLFSHVRHHHADNSRYFRLIEWFCWGIPIREIVSRNSVRRWILRFEKIFQSRLQVLGVLGEVSELCR